MLPDHTFHYNTTFRCVVKADWACQFHSHESHELTLIVRGTFRSELEDQQIQAEAGEAIFYPAGTRHHPRCTSAAGGELIALMWHGIALSTRPTKMPDLKGRAFILMSWLLELGGETTEAAAQQRQRLLGSLLYQFLADARDARETDLREIVRRFVLSRPADQISLEHLAALVHMSKFHFSRRFREQCGDSPMRFVRKQRLHIARQLLVSSNLTTETIAETVGMVDASHFGRCFKEIYGSSPSQYRAQMQRRKPGAEPREESGANMDAPSPRVLENEPTPA